MEKTEWFPAEVKPIREGLYEVKSVVHENKVLFSYWTNSWGWIHNNPESAMRASNPTGYQNRIWRGLKENPNAN